MISPRALSLTLTPLISKQEISILRLTYNISYLVVLVGRSILAGDYLDWLLIYERQLSENAQCVLQRRWLCDIWADSPSNCVHTG